jgi:glutathione synthase/RimK-type ligase-like ATP-grasp enzyme
MMSKPSALIISTKADTATDEVAARLSQRGIPYHRIDTEDYPFAKAITFEPATTTLQCDGTRLPVPTSIWYRRERTAPTPDGMDEGIATFCRHETRATILGSIMGRQTRWMSHPAAVWQAEFKPYQLHLANKLGLTIPRTLITNDPSTIRNAFASFGSMIVKPTRTGYVHTREGEYAVYTSRVLEHHLDELESARWSPSIYQECITKAYDVRVTVVGNQYFAALIDSQSDPAASVDWRQTDNPNLPHERLILPNDLAGKLGSLMSALHLTFGAIDLIKTPDGRYIFLEVNPSGQWLWLDDMLNLGISDAVTDWLATCN